MASKNKLYKFLSDDVSFISKKNPPIRTIYFPLCGTHSSSLKSSISPYLSGDIKIDTIRYLTKPVSTEDLRNPTRNFFIFIKDKGVISLADDTQSASFTLEAGQLWQKITKK